MNKISKTSRGDPEKRPPAVDWRQCAAFLDFDGTLAPLEEHPDLVCLPARERRIIGRLLELCDGAVAILTGRDLDGIRGHFEGLPVAFGGSHGAEILLPGGQADAHVAPEKLDGPGAAMDAFAREHGLLLEHKAAAVALHYRGRADMADKVVALVDQTARSDADLKPLHGNMVSEVTLKEHDKGTALVRLMTEAGFKGRRPIAIGDDTTDEDAIRAARSLGGTGLRIGSTSSDADYVFESREAFVDWLEDSVEDA